MGANKAPQAHFASLRSNLLVVERSARPVFANGREISTEPGKYHEFIDHRCVVSGKESIEHIRRRASAPDSPGIWEMDAADMPEVTDLLAELATAEVDRVREILKYEEDGPNRLVVMEVCRRVLIRSNVSERRPGERVTVSG